MTLIEPQRFLDDLERQLRRLSAQAQMAFGAMCCDRHFPEYLRFSKEQRWGDPNTLRVAIDLTWMIASDHKKVNHSELSSLLKQCIEATPDSDDFPTVVSDYAQDVAAMVCHLLKFLEERNITSIVEVASKARD